MKHGSLFSGIGGFDLAAEWMGWENVFHCEWNPFGQKVLKHYWPKAKSYGDITTTDFTIHRGEVDIITGGFPCQPYSQAGKRKGKADDRHLWPEMLRAIREVQPRWIVGENVSGLLNWSRGLVLDEIKADLEAAGFEVIPPLVLPACAVNAPHRRDRVWIVAYSNVVNGQKKNESYQVNNRKTQTQFNRLDRMESWSKKYDRSRLQSAIHGRINGISPELDGIAFQEHRQESIKGYGNSIVPQVVFEIFKVIKEMEKSFLSK